MRLYPKRMLALVAMALLAASCNSSRDSGAPLPAGSPLVDVTMRDFAFEHVSEIPAGRVVFRVHNAGEAVHRAALLPLPEDLPPIDAQLRGTERRAIAPFAGIYDRTRGQKGTFAVDLVAGQRYAFVCFVIDEGGSHALRGMSSEFRAKATPASSTPTN